MSWVTFIWSMTAGICLALGGVHFLVWTRRRDLWAHLVFSISAGAAAGYAVLDLLVLRAQTPAEYGTWMRWMLSLGMLEGVAIAGFVRLYLRAGRLWLLWLICGLRALMLVLNFVPGPNFYFREISGLHQVLLLGELTAHPQGVLHRWSIVMQLSLLLIIIFVLDAARTASKESGRRRAWVLGALMSGGFSVALISYALYGVGILPSTFSSQLFLALILLMGYELSLDVLRAGQLSRELVESQQRMRQAASAADLSLWDWDLVRDEIWTTDIGRERAGIGASERIDFDRFLQSVHPEDRESTLEAVRHALEVSGEFEAEYRVIGWQGAARWVVARGHLERNTKGEPLRLRGVTVDITTRKQAESALRESEARFRTVADSTPVLIWMSGVDKLYIFFNKGWLDFTGRTLEQEVGNGWVQGVHPDDVAGCLKTYVESFDARRPFTIEYRLRRRDGEYRWLLDHGVPRYDSGGNFLGYIGSCSDLTERKKAEDELAQQRNELSHLSRVTTMSELSSSLAHELNQPLAIILTNAQAAQRLLAQEPPDVAETREILADIVGEDERAGEVIRRLRALLKPGQTQRLPLSVNQVIDEVLRIARSDLIGRGVTVHTELAESTPKVLGDRIQLQQVLLNLVLNASDAMAANPREQHRLTIATTHRGDLVRISVSDNGCGLPSEPERIFQPFYTTKKDGLGLGLAICRSIATAHQGRLWAEARGPANVPPGAAGITPGTTLHLELPALGEEEEIVAGKEAP